MSLQSKSLSAEAHIYTLQTFNLSLGLVGPACQARTHLWLQHFGYPPGVASSSLVSPGRGVKSCCAMETSVVSGAIKMVPPKVHAWSELKYQCSSSRVSAKKWLTVSALSCSLQVHWLKRNVRETMPKCHQPELAWAVLHLFPSFPALPSPTSLI